MEPIVIIGTGLAGYSTARELRKHDADVPLVMLSRDAGDYYYKPDLSEALAKGRAPADLIRKPAAQMAAELDADVRAHVEVEAIDPAAHAVVVNGAALRYSRLVLASGARPIAPALAGDAADAVHQINNHGDYVPFRAALDTAQTVVVLGAGLIGCEFSNDLAARGLAVHCVDPVAWPLQRFLPETCGVALRGALAATGVHWHLGRMAAAVQHAEGVGYAVELDDGTLLQADVVLCAIGLRPALELAGAAGLAVNRGVVVDRYLQTSDPHICALGDCAEVDGQFRPFVSPLMQAARALGNTLAGAPTPVKYPTLPVIVKTPACPTLVYPSPVDGGTWQIEGAAPDLAASYMHGRQLTGFALTGAATKQRGQFIRVAPPILP